MQCCSQSSLVLNLLKLSKYIFSFQNNLVAKKTKHEAYKIKIKLKIVLGR